ncbi:MAG: LysR family transcriptional regulator [Opitutales bacterium]|nr:LysR family transcriptional regulator [Opitutales bacterium]
MRSLAYLKKGIRGNTFWLDRVYLCGIVDPIVELRHLRYFVAVAEVENVTLAAQRLHVSQPPLSRQIHQLEEEVGCALFERTGKSLRLTPAGEVFAREAKAILAKVGEAAAAARATTEAAGELRVGYAPSLVVKILPKVLRLCKERAPEVRIRLHDLSTMEMVRQVRGGDLDVALAVHPGTAALRGLTFHEIERLPACVVLPLPHPLARAKSPHLKDLAEEPVVAFTREDYPEYRRWLASVFKTIQRRARIVEEHDSITSLIAAVEAGQGIAFGGDGFKALCGTRLCVRRLDGFAPPIRVGAIHSPRSIHPAVRLLLANG